MGNLIGKNIYALRKKQELTQEELAELVNVSFQAVSKWENGNSIPDTKEIFKVVKLPQLKKYCNFLQ